MANLQIGESQFASVGNHCQPVGLHFGENNTLVRAQIHFVVLLCNRERLGQFPGTRTQLVHIGDPAPALHERDPARGLQRANQHEPVLLPFHQDIEHPVNAIVKINVGGPGFISFDKRARARTNETMTRFVTDRVVSFGLNDNSGAPIPIQLAADKLARTTHWITLKKTCANDFAAHRVASAED